MGEPSAGAVVYRVDMIRTILLLGRSKLPEVDILSASALTYGVSMILTILMLGRDQSCLM